MGNCVNPHMNFSLTKNRPGDTEPSLSFGGLTDQVSEVWCACRFGADFAAEWENNFSNGLAGDSGKNLIVTRELWITLSVTVSICMLA